MDEQEHTRQRPSGKAVACAIGCIAAGAALIGVIGVNAGNAYANIVDNAAVAMGNLQTRCYDDYTNASLSYIDDLVMAQGTDDKVVGVVVPKDSVNDSTFSSTLEAAGLDPTRVVRDEDGTYVYLIKQGDTLTSLSAAFGHSVDELANFNQIRNVDLIYADSALRVPNN